MKTAIVTGAGRGIGRATAVRLAGPDVTLIINYNSSSRGADETAELCREKGAEVVTVQADVSKASDCEKLVSAALEKTGRVDVLVNNAGITRDGRRPDAAARRLCYEATSAWRARTDAAAKQKGPAPLQGVQGLLCLYDSISSFRLRLLPCTFSEPQE